MGSILVLGTRRRLQLTSKMKIFILFLVFGYIANVFALKCHVCKYPKKADGYCGKGKEGEKALGTPTECPLGTTTCGLVVLGNPLATNNRMTYRTCGPPSQYQPLIARLEKAFKFAELNCSMDNCNGSAHVEGK